MNHDDPYTRQPPVHQHVEVRPTPRAGSIPQTGTDIGLLVFIALLVIVYGALLVWSKRRYFR